MSTQHHLSVVTIFMSFWIGCAGIFVPFFIAACYVQWDRVSKGRGTNRLMVFATAFFGLTVTTVSEGRPPKKLSWELTQ